MLLTLTLNSNNCVFSYFTSDFPYFCSDNTFLALFSLMDGAPYSVLCEEQGQAPLVRCRRRWISPLELAVEGQHHKTGLFCSTVYALWLMQSFSETLLREKTNMSQELQKNLGIPSKELCKT